MMTVLDDFGDVQQALLRAERDWLGERMQEEGDVTIDELIGETNTRLHRIARDLESRLSKMTDGEIRQLLAAIVEEREP
jgi:hypothetical protein